MVTSFDSPYIQIFRSELKLNLIMSLLGGGKELSDLRDDLGSSGSTIIHALQDLESLRLSHKDDKRYQLTSIGKVFSIFLKEVDSMITVLEEFKDFWLRHDIEVIPLDLLKRIGELNNSYLVRDSVTDLAKVHMTFQEILLTSRNLKGASPIFHPDFVRVFQQLLKSGANVELILTSEVLEKTLDLMDANELFGYVQDGLLKMYLLDNLRLALTVTEHSFSLGLFTLNGAYDYGMDLISNSESSLKWGENLFEVLLEKSEPIERGQIKIEGS
jgi:predicted transcriptional regulator